MLQLNITEAIGREPDQFRLQKLEDYIDAALRRSNGVPAIAFRNLLALAENESDLADIICDVVMAGFAKHFFRTCEHLQHTSD